MKLGNTVIFESGNGKEALAVIQRERPDIVLTDVMMSEMDGLEMIEVLRRHERNDMRFIIISAYHDFMYAQKGIAPAGQQLFAETRIPGGIVSDIGEKSGRK